MIELKYLEKIQNPQTLENFLLVEGNEESAYQDTILVQNSITVEDSVAEVQSQTIKDDTTKTFLGGWEIVGLVPKSITIRQAKLQLLAIGKLADVESYITTSTNEALKIEWEYASLFKRDSQILNGVALSMGLTKEMIDDFFIAASKL
ncbi:MAG: hypothetical protein RBR02_11290 [Desulfuromonadaceae bacterium]|nr:hypothetical protein [Desulfuromonadaceae bacterium]